MKTNNYLVLLLTFFFIPCVFASERLFNEDAKQAFKALMENGEAVTTKVIIPEEQYAEIRDQLKEKFSLAGIGKRIDHTDVRYSKVVGISTVEDNDISCEKLIKMIVISTLRSSVTQEGFIKYVGDYHWLKKDKELSNVSLQEMYICEIK